MSLDWSVTEVEDYENRCYVQIADEQRLNPVTNALIWGAMAVGLRQITRENVSEWTLRLRLFQVVHGSVVTDGTMPTYEDVEQHVGLSTNVQDEPRNKWLVRQFGDDESVSPDSPDLEDDSADDPYVARAKELYALSDQGEWDELDVPLQERWIDAAREEAKP